MTVHDAALRYRYWRHLASEPCTWCSEPYCLLIRRRWLLVEAASVAYDAAVAEASIERIRRTVAYA